jgi:hypothetical protein
LRCHWTPWQNGNNIFSFVFKLHTNMASLVADYSSSGESDNVVDSDSAPEA